MTRSVLKHPLALDKYQDYEIPQEYTAYTIEFPLIDQDDCDDLEFQYLQQGYKLFHTQLVRRENGKFNYTIIVGKCEILF